MGIFDLGGCGEAGAGDDCCHDCEMEVGWLMGSGRVESGEWRVDW